MRRPIQTFSSGTSPGGRKAKRKEVYQSRELSCGLLGFPVVSDQAVGGTVVGKLRFFFAFKFGDDALRQDFTQFDTPLVERVDVPDCALSESGVFIQRHKFAEGLRGQPFREDRV